MRKKKRFQDKGFYFLVQIFMYIQQNKEKGCKEK